MKFSEVLLIFLSKNCRQLKRVKSGMTWQKWIFSITAISAPVVFFTIKLVKNLKRSTSPLPTFLLGNAKLGEEYLVGNVGVIANQSSQCINGSHIVDVLHNCESTNLTAIFAPEHGFRGELQAGIPGNSYVDSSTGIQVFDIYLKSGKALVEIFEKSKVNTIIFDIQDVGVRFFTFIWTLFDCMEAISLMNRPIRFILSDRPNPLGGHVTDGPIMRGHLATFVGRKPIPLLHGMTIAELALLFNSEFIPSGPGKKEISLTIWPMEGWKRGTLFSQLNLPWIPPSPNLRSFHSVLLYPGICLFEGTNVSEGRGSPLPFQMIGAPWMVNNPKFEDEVGSLNFPGVSLKWVNFVPTFSKYSGTLVHGIQVNVEEESKVNGLELGITFLVLFKKHFSEFKWRKNSTGSTFWIDNLVGSTTLREGVDSGLQVDEIMSQWQDDLTHFSILRAKYLLYQ